MRAIQSPLALLCLFLPSLFLTGCVRDRMFQPPPHDPPALVDFHPEINPTEKGKPFIIAHPERPANHATVEIKNHGKFFCPEGESSCQLKYAVSFVRQARLEAAPERLVVLTFVHGNENNASESSDNYPHFEQLLSCLNMGEAAYQVQYHELIRINNLAPKAERYVTCAGVPRPEGVHYVGIYIGWQGQLFRGVLNLQQNAAMRIGKQAAIGVALKTLRDAAKQDIVPVAGLQVKYPASFVVIGHSFGGLLVEQAANKIYRDAYTTISPANLRPCPAGSTPDQGLKPFTDLIVTVNEAVNSLPAMRLMNFFDTKGDVFCHSDKLAPSLPLPFLVALHSKSDFFTGATGTVLRYIVPPRGGLFPTNKGETKMFFFHPINWLLFTHSTPANLIGFQNLCYIDAHSFYPEDGSGYRTGDRGGDCDSISQVTDPNPLTSGQSATPNHTFAKALLFAPETSRASHLHVRFDCSHQAPDYCKNDDRSQSVPAKLGFDHYNTPYWIISLDDAVVSGHNDLWTSKIIELILDMSKAWDTLTSEQVLN